MKKHWVKWLLGTVLVAVPAFLLSPVLFPPGEGGPVPTSGQLPYFLFLGASDAVLLGFGISSMLFGYPMLRKVSFDSVARAWAMYLSIGYPMVSWWPYLGMHASNGLDLQGLLAIDYVFHLPLEIAGAVLAYFAFASFRSWMCQSPLHSQQELGGEDRLAECPTRLRERHEPFSRDRGLERPQPFSLHKRLSVSAEPVAVMINPPSWPETRQ